MKISKGVHKQFLLDLFVQPHPHVSGQIIAKEFSLEDLFDASSAKKKIAPLIREATDEEINIYLKGQKVSDEEMNNLRKNLKTTIFKDEEVEFTPSEIVILKKLFDSKKTWSVEQADIVKELKDIFYPEKKE